MSNKQSPRPQWKTTALHSAIAAFCANGLLITQAQADALCGPTISVNQEQCVAEDSQDIVVDSGVIISTTDEAAVLYMGNLGFTEGGEDTYGSLTNNGSILSSGTGEDHWGGLNPVVGVAIQGELLGTLTNTGVISGTSSNAYSSYAYGIREGGFPAMQGTISNSGTISASSTSADSYADAIAVYIENSIAADALIENLAGGSITATATAPDAFGAAAGVFTQSFYGTLTNHGEISAMVNAPAGIAAGVYTWYFDGTLNNHGTISASIADGGEGQATGLFVGTMGNAEVNNYGTIAGTSADGGEGYSILTYGSEGSSTVNNMQGGVLRGRLHLGGYGVSISNAGLIDLPMLANAGYVAGDFTQTDTGTLRIMAAGSGEDEYSTLWVDGIATIAGNAFVDVKAVNSLAVGQTLGRVVSAFELTGNFAQVEDNSALFNFRSLATQGEEGYIDFEIVKALTAVEAVNANNNPVARGAAGALDSIIDSGTSNANMQAVINALGSLGTSQEVSDAVSQTLPLLAGSSAIASSAALTGINRVIQSRIESNRGMSSGDTFYGDHKLWLKPFGSLADQNDRDGAAGYEANVGGLALGIDGTVSDATRLGVAFAYAKADIDGNSKVAPNSAEVDVFQLLGYGSHSLDSNTELNFQAGIGQNNTAGKRKILFLGETARADYSSLVTTAGVGLARTYKLNESTDFTPSVRTDYTWIKDEGYTEKGSSANLKVDSRSTDELILGLDGKLSHEFMPGTSVSANLGVGYDALNSQTSITSAFAGEPGVGFTTRGLDPSPWLQRAGLGLTTNTDNGMEISLRYDAEHRESFLNQTASVKLRWDF
ncbi:MAG: autotransporter domain-containing protein [Pseudomonas sp.]|nr:autotransporter domain-containing protein [Pseudomonas sp.]